jgi:hypothetical protein
MMQIWARKLVPALLLLAVLQPLLAQQPPAPVRVRFAFGALTGVGSNRKLIRIAEDTQLGTGDRLKLMVEMQQPGFIYLIHRSPDNEIDLLFPAELKQAVQLTRKYYIPEGAQWFELDRNPGNETFYLLASARRLDDLELLLERYAKSPASGRAAITTGIVSEIRKLRTQNLDAGAQAERPVMIGGNVRSLDTAPGSALPDVSTIAVDISAKDFYARTFTIDHR